MARKGHREAIFTDTVLREMGIDLPQNLEEMRAIPGIRPEMVDLYGVQFLDLIENTRNFYGEEAPVPKNPSFRNRPRVAQAISDDDEQVDDQNHKLVVDLCSEAEDMPGAVEPESDYSFDDDEEEGDDDDDGAVHTSHHFGQNMDPQVAQFNSRYSELGGAAASASRPAKAAPSRAGPRASAAATKKGRSFRKKGSGSFGGSYGGVKKRGAKGTSSRVSGGVSASKKATGGSNRKGGLSGGSGAASTWGSIMAMPT